MDRFKHKSNFNVKCGRKGAGMKRKGTADMANCLLMIDIPDDRSKCSKCRGEQEHVVCSGSPNALNSIHNHSPGQ